MMVGATGIEPARVLPTRVQFWRVFLSATLRLSSYGRCPPREGDRESPSHWPNPRARPSRRLEDSRRLGHQVKAVASVLLLSEFQAEDAQTPLGLNTFQAAACCSCLARYFPGAGRSIFCSSTKRTRVDLREFILSFGSCKAVATLAAVNSCPSKKFRNLITRSVSVPYQGLLAING